MRAFEVLIRERIGARLARGKVECRLSVQRAAAAESTRVNPAALAGLQRLGDEVRQVLPQVAPLSVADVLGWPGVLEMPALDADALRTSVLAALEQALDRLQESRAREGAAIADGLRDRCDGIAAIVGQLHVRLPELRAAVERKLWAAADVLLPARGIERYTQGLMDLGATVCTRAAPRCAACPVALDCVARTEARVDRLPSPRPRRALPRREVRLLLIERAGEILFERRPATGIWSGLWSLPELPVDADVPEALRGRFGVDAHTVEALAPVVHGFTHFTLTIHPVRVAARAWRPRVESPEQRWLARDDALSAALPAPIKRLVRDLPGN